MHQQELIKTTKLLEKYKIHLAKSELVKSKEKAINYAKKIGCPVAMKIISKEIIHKSDAGGVKVNLRNDEEVGSAYDAILKSVKKKFPRAKIDGILVQRMEAGKEIIIGIKQDPQFGPVIMFGLGGVFVEVLKDVSFRVAPINKAEAEKMIKEVRAFEILKGVRGEKPANLLAIIDLLVKVSKLAAENKKILELDLNPVVVDEKSAKVVDMRAMIE